MRVIHGYAHKTKTYGSAYAWIGPLEVRIMTGAAAHVQIYFKVWVNFRRVLRISRDEHGRIMVWAWKGTFPRR